jgi:hypothetical protein
VPRRKIKLGDHQGEAEDLGAQLHRPWHGAVRLRQTRAKPKLRRPPTPRTAAINPLRLSASGVCITKICVGVIH